MGELTVDAVNAGNFASATKRKEGFKCHGRKVQIHQTERCARSHLLGIRWAADIKVMSDSPLQPALTKVIDLYRQQTHNQVNLVFDPSPAVKARIENGEQADVVIVQPDFAEELTKVGKLSAGDRPIIGHVGVGLGNRKDSPAYDISTVRVFKNTLLGADLLCLQQR